MRRALQGESAQRQDGQTQGLWSHPNGPFGIQGACAEPGRPVGRVRGSVMHWTRPEPPLQVRARPLRLVCGDGSTLAGSQVAPGTGREESKTHRARWPRVVMGAQGVPFREAPPSWCCWIRSLEARDLTAL